MKYWVFLFLILLTACKKQVNSDSIQRFKGTVVYATEFIFPTANAASGEICTSKKSASAKNYLELSLLDKNGSLKVICSTDIDSKGNYEFLINKSLLASDAVLSVNGKLNGSDRSHITALNQLSTDNSLSPLSTVVAGVHLEIIKAGQSYSKDSTNKIKALFQAVIAQSEFSEVDYLKIIKDNGISTTLIKDAFNLSKIGSSSAAAAKLTSFENIVATFSDPIKVALDKAAADAALLKSTNDKIAADLAAAAKAVADQIAASIDAAKAASASAAASAAAAKSAFDKAIADAAAKAASDAAIFAAAELAAAKKAAADAATAAAIKASADAAIAAATKAAADKAISDAIIAKAASDKVAADKAAADAAILQAAADKAAADLAATQLAAAKAAADAAAKIAADIAAAEAAKVIADKAIAEAALKAAADAAALQAAIEAKAAEDKAATELAVQAAADAATKLTAEETATAKSAATERSIANANDAQKNYLGKIASFFTDLTITPLFDLESTGWINSSKEPISVNITSTSEKTIYKCRYAHTGLVSVLDFQDCKIDDKGNLSLYPPEFGNTNGSFQLQVQAESGEFATIAKTIDFYVHDSLNLASTCTPYKTNAEYLALAANYLDQSLTFTEKTNLKIPFVQIGFSAMSSGEYLPFIGRSESDTYKSDIGESSYEVRSLRKRFVENEARTLVIIRRKYEGRFGKGNCSMGIPGQFTSYNLVDGQFPDLKNELYGDYRKSQCDVLIMNAAKKGLCFVKDAVYFTSDLGRALATRGNSQNITSGKFTKNEKDEFDYYNNSWLKNSDANPLSKPIFLDDDSEIAEKAKSDIAVDEFGINILAMLNKDILDSIISVHVRDPKTNGVVNDDETKAFLMYALNLTLEDIELASVQNYIATISPEVLEKAFYFYKYGNKDLAKLTLEKFGIGTKSRAIASLTNTPSPINVVNLIIAPKFDTQSTGWLNEVKESILVSIASKSNGAKFKCRFSHATEISVMAYTTCDIDKNGNLSLQQPSFGVKNGLFQLDVQATSESLVAADKSINFYVHDSLNFAKACTPPKTDAEYMEIAAKYLDQSLKFESGTSLKAPFVQINFPAVEAGDHMSFINHDQAERYDSSKKARGYDIRSLRKRFSTNELNSFILIKRAYPHRFNSYGACGIHISGITPELYFNKTEENWLNQNINVLAGDAINTTNTDRSESSKDCDSLVFNAYGKGLCFFNDEAYFVSDIGSSLETRVRDNGVTNWRNQKIASAKFTKTEKEQYENNVGNLLANGMVDAESRYIYLEDAAGPEAARDIASVETAAKMIFKILDNMTGALASNELALEYLAYGLQMTPENIVKPEVQKYLTSIDKEYLQRGLLIYLYEQNQRENLPKYMDEWKIGTEARAIAGVEAIESPWKIVIRDFKLARNLTQAEMTNFLANLLNVKAEDLLVLEMQELLSANAELMMKAYEIFTYGNDEDKQLVRNELSKEVLPRSAEIENALLAKIAQTIKDSLDTEIFTDLTVTPTFDLVTTGWTDENAEKIHADAASTTPNAVIKCRFGHATEISVLAFTDCSTAKDGNVILTQPDYGTKNGKFQLDVQATASGLPATTQTLNFYVHDSLNNSATCPNLAKSDAEYLEEAAQYLDQSLTFGDNTSFKNPLVKIEFSAINAGGFINTILAAGESYRSSNIPAQIIQVRSLRKRFAENSAKTLILIKRFYDKRNNPGFCSMNIPLQARGNNITQYDGNELISPFADFNLANGTIPQSNVGQKISYSTSPCDVLVVNAAGKSVCFDHGKVYYAKNLKKSIAPKGRMRNDLYSYYSKISSSKFTVNEKDQYDYTVNAAAKIGMIKDSSDPEHQFIYLDDTDESRKGAAEERSQLFLDKFKEAAAQPLIDVRAME